MATVNKILLPRRATKTTMQSGDKPLTVLQRGEIFIECQDSPGKTIGNGPAKIKIGDGATPYKDLKYSIGDTPNDAIDFAISEDTSLNNIWNKKMVSGISISKMFGYTKRAFQKTDQSITSINTSLKNLTDNNTIKHVSVVDELPSSPSSDTIYFILVQ